MDEVELGNKVEYADRVEPELITRWNMLTG